MTTEQACPYEIAVKHNTWSTYDPHETDFEEDSCDLLTSTFKNTDTTHLNRDIDIMGFSREDTKDWFLKRKNYMKDNLFIQFSTGQEWDPNAPVVGVGTSTLHGNFFRLKDLKYSAFGPQGLIDMPYIYRGYYFRSFNLITADNQWSSEPINYAQRMHNLPGDIQPPYYYWASLQSASHPDGDNWAGWSISYVSMPKEAQCLLKVYKKAGVDHLRMIDYKSTANDMGGSEENGKPIYITGMRGTPDKAQNFTYDMFETGYADHTDISERDKCGLSSNLSNRYANIKPRKKELTYRYTSHYIDNYLQGHEYQEYHRACFEMIFVFPWDNLLLCWRLYLKARPTDDDDVRRRYAHYLLVRSCDYTYTALKDGDRVNDIFGSGNSEGCDFMKDGGVSDAMIRMMFNFYGDPHIAHYPGPSDEHDEDPCFARSDYDKNDKNSECYGVQNLTTAEDEKKMDDAGGEHNPWDTLMYHGYHFANCLTGGKSDRTKWLTREADITPMIHTPGLNGGDSSKYINKDRSFHDRNDSRLDRILREKNTTGESYYTGGENDTSTVEYAMQCWKGLGRIADPVDGHNEWICAYHSMMAENSENIGEETFEQFCGCESHKYMKTRHQREKVIDMGSNRNMIFADLALSQDDFMTDFLDKLDEQNQGDGEGYTLQDLSDVSDVYLGTNDRCGEDIDVTMIMKVRWETEDKARHQQSGCYQSCTNTIENISGDARTQWDTAAFNARLGYTGHRNECFPQFAGCINHINDITIKDDFDGQVTLEQSCERNIEYTNGSGTGDTLGTAPFTPGAPLPADSDDDESDDDSNTFAWAGGIAAALCSMFVIILTIILLLM